MIIHLTFQRKRHLLPAILNPSAIELKYGASNAFTDYSLSYGYIPGPATQQSVKGVKINCIGDQKMSNKPNFEAVEIPSTDPIFSTHDTSDITKRIGFPIFTRHCLPDPKWANHQDSKIFEHQIPFNNQDATWRVCTRT